MNTEKECKMKAVCLDVLIYGCEECAAYEPQSDEATNVKDPLHLKCKASKVP